MEEYFNHAEEIHRWVLADKYYLLDEEGNVRHFLGKTDELLEYMKEKVEDISSFINDNKLDVSNRNHLISILDYNNFLQNRAYNNYECVSNSKSYQTLKNEEP